MSRRLPSVLLLCLLAAAAPASAAPVGATATLTVGVQGFAPVSVAGAGTVDLTGGVLTVPVGLVTQIGTIVVPVTGTTAIDNFSLVGLSNLSATFSVGGVTAQSPSEICTGGGPNANGSGGNACNVGGGVGGIMGLTGTLRLHIIPNIVVLPFNLARVRVGRGGSTNAPYLIDAAAWTTRTALVNTGVNVRATTIGSSGAGSFTLVAPTYISGCGIILPMFAALTIQLSDVPEPGVWVLSWFALLGVHWLTRKR